MNMLLACYINWVCITYGCIML